MKGIQLFAIIIFLLGTMSFKKQDSRFEQDLSNQKWSIWLDKHTDWQHDSLFLPPVDIQKLKVNIPTCGWKELYLKHDIETHLPATVEQFYWGTFENQKDSFIDLVWAKTPARLKEDYIGVSWFYTDMDVSNILKNKRIILEFASCRQRSEIYVNEQLVGYDCIGNTPFDVDITKVVKIGKNKIAVRITDPGGQYDWMDFMVYKWSNYDIPSSHGFGGITGNVKLIATDQTYINDIFIKNKPTITDIDAVFSMAANGALTKGTITYTISNYKSPDNIILKREVKVSNQETIENIQLADAKTWSPETPNLYLIKAEWKGDDGSSDFKVQRFGFRWFDVQDVNGDKQLFLNGKRVFVLTAISWGFWPQNGIFPTPELAKKQIIVAKQLGLNMLNFHRTIGQTISLDLADEMGIMFYEEPGGYIAPEPNASKFAHQFEIEKVNRMIKRDRNHPALVIYNMKNEACCSAGNNDKKNIANFHNIDETRLITFSSQNYPPNFLGKAPLTPHDAKLYMLPYNHELLYQGWWDEHHAGGPGCYIDTMNYQNPTKYTLYTDHKNEIIYYGEEGSIGTVSRVQLINDEVKKRKYAGYDGKYYQDIYNVYNHFLKENKWEEYYKDVDAITVSMGNIGYYYQGRTIENCRINNIVDGYAINGWESTLCDNLSGVVDLYRNPKGNVELISRYSKPLYIAVKPHNKVLESGDSTIVDFFIVNQLNVSGEYTLKIKIKDSLSIEEKEFKVKVEGGNTYGQLLVKDINYRTQKKTDSRYITISASLIKDRQTIAEGNDKLFVVSLPPNNSTEYSILDNDGELQKYFTDHQIKYNLFDNTTKPKSQTLLAGKTDTVIITNALIEWIKAGNKLIIIDGADRWANALAKKELIQYQGRVTLRTIWWGGNFFNRKHEFFDGLPVNQALNWEYQVMVRYNSSQKEGGNNRYGLKLRADEIMCAAVNMEDPLITVAVGTVNLGKGKIVFSTLPVLPYLNITEKAAITAQRLLLNYLKLQ